MSLKEQEINYYKMIAPNKVSIIKNTVAEYFGVTSEMLESKNRQRFLCDIRFIAMYLVKQNVPKMTLKSIGYNFGYRDHSTVINAFTKVELAIQEIGEKKYLQLELKVKEAVK